MNKNDNLRNLKNKLKYQDSNLITFTFISKVNESIKNLILTIDNKHENIDEETIVRMSESLTIFCYDAINKFIAGQKKHGGKITDKDLDKEINQELLDLFWYLNAKIWKYDDEDIKNNENIKNIKNIKNKEEVNTTEVEQQSNST